MQGTASSVKKCKQPVKMHRRSWWRPVTRRGTTDVLTWSVVEDAGPASLSAGCLGWHYYCEQRRGRRPRSGRSPGGHAGLGLVQNFANLVRQGVGCQRLQHDGDLVRGDTVPCDVLIRITGEVKNLRLRVRGRETPGEA